MIYWQGLMTIFIIFSITEMAPAKCFITKPADGIDIASDVMSTLLPCIASFIQELRDLRCFTRASLTTDYCNHVF